MQFYLENRCDLDTHLWTCDVILSNMMVDTLLPSAQHSIRIHSDQFPWDVCWSFVQECVACTNEQLHQLSGWLVSDRHAGVETRCSGPVLVWLHVVCSCEASLMYSQIRWKDMETDYDNGTNVQLASNTAGGHSSSSMLVVHALKTQILCVALQCISW